MSEMTDQDVMGPSEMSDEDVFGKPAAPAATPGTSFADRFDAVNPPAPESFLHRVALGLMIGEHGQSPAELRAKGLEDFDVWTNTVDHFKAGAERMKKGFTESHSAYEVGVGAFDALMSPLSAAFQAVGGAGEKATGGLLTGDQINTALMVSDGAAGRISRVRGGVEQVIGAMPKAEDFSQAAKVLVEKPEAAPIAETNLKQMWQDDGIHPAEAVHDAQADAFLKHDIIAYHGTPHEFDRFDISKIGAGEGAQAYGHGLYFAENPKVAGSYREQLAFTEGGGNVYQVRIKGSTEHFLNWDKTLQEQTPEVRKMLDDSGLLTELKSIGADKEATVQNLIGSLRRGYSDTSPSFEHSEIAQKLRDAGIPGIRYLDRDSRHLPDVEELTRSIENVKATLERDPGKVSAQKLLSDYETQLGEAKQGTRNIVVFSDKDIEITHKNDVPVAGYPMPREDFDALAETGGGAQSLSAMRTPPEDMAPLVSPLVEPARPPGRLAAAFKDAGDKLLDIGRDAQMLVAPMARGTRDSMAIAKDFANSIRRNRWDWARIDKDIADRFSPESRARMWTAADEESVSLQLKEPAHMREHQGLATLEPAERAVVEEMHARAQNAWLRARDVGMVEGEGLPAYTPRMIINTMGAGGKEKALPLNSIGANLKTKTANLLKRQYLESQETEAAAKAKYGDEAMLARDIRVLPLATSQLEDAIAGRTLINNIKAYGKSTGAETVVEGAIPVGSDTKWFTLDHPAFRTWRPKFETIDGKVQAMKDSAGNAVFEQVPIYVHGDFEGPLRAVLSQKSGALYGGMMALKGKTMSLIMNSPMIHNAVEWGRAVPAMPGKVATFKVYFEGNRAKNDVAVMHEAIDSGLVPIGHRFFNQDITSIMESPDLTPGRSWTAKVAGFLGEHLPQKGMTAEEVATQAKRSIDKAGDFWHNTLLWDRVADLQMGLYVNFRADAIAKGIDQATASRMAAHWANRYAGALPKEAMSDGATKIANLLMFSRSFTMGNLGVLKDMFTGLPKDVLAQIERDAGFGKGSIEAAEAGQQAVDYAKSMARRKAAAVIAIDIGMMYVGNSILQNAMNVLFNDSTLDKEMHGYAERFMHKMQAVREHPLELVQPLKLLEDLSATSENEPGRKDRVRIGSAADGTVIYARNPVGKIGDEFIGWMNGPLDMMRKKMGTLARPAWQVMNNDAGFGRKVYDPGADTPAKYLSNIGKIVAHIAGSQLPEGQMRATFDLVKGEGDAKVNALQALGPFVGVTFSKGAPGGPAVGEMYAARSQHDFQVNQALPDIRKQILRGDVAGAIDRMKELGIPAGLQRFYIKTSLNPATRLSPRAVKDFYGYATPEQLERFQRARQGQ